MTGFESRFSLASLIAVVALSFGTVAAQAADRYTVSADGQEVLDSKTNLQWRRCAEGMSWDGKTCTGKATKYKLGDAKAHAAEQAKAAGKGWRVPNKDELAALVDKSKKKPAIDTNAFPNTPADLFWALRPGFDDNLNAWLISFANGKVYGNSGEKKIAVRLVRTND
ncbi:DUF1566 domain-containing protein [Chitinimonas sp.]|uniref:Lcl C-terminal domain-containing protein n=1 Tax=Chitinimonas sp. TaxID=1934313 RepID=UPI0035B298FE